MKESDLLPLLSEAMYLTQKEHDIDISMDHGTFTIHVADSKGAIRFSEAMIELLKDHLSDRSNPL
jgi:hypothetical protein